MLRLSPRQMLERIERAEPFHAVSEDYSFVLKIDRYLPLVCGAVHEGHQFRKELWDKCLHSSFDRWYEEDPCTLEMIGDHPIVISGCDSRFEYDLNREPERAIYEDAWGKKLWLLPLTDKERKTSLSKHQQFYQIVEKLLEKLNTMFESVLVVDMHSYNKNRWDREVPVWNIGSSNIDNRRFGSQVESWREKLATINLGGEIPRTASINDTFQGNGYFLKFITHRFPNSLVLATEISKVYCDEDRRIIFPEIVQAARLGLREFIPLQLREFNGYDY